MAVTSNAPRVSLFVSCLVDQIRPAVGQSTVELLRRIGCSVHFNSDHTCCGQPAYTSGFADDAKKVARRTIEVFEKDTCDWIVVPSGSCAAMLHHYPKIFVDEPDWARRAVNLISKIHELSTYLVDVMGITDVESDYSGKLTWHDACHGLRDLGVRDQPRQLLKGLPRAEFVETDKCDTCCGFGGVFASNYPEISTSMADAKLDAIASAGIDAVVSGDVGCLMQLQTRAQHRQLKLEFLHLAEVFSVSE